MAKFEVCCSRDWRIKGYTYSPGGGLLSGCLAEIKEKKN